jgi:hypothetical protein
MLDPEIEEIWAIGVEIWMLKTLESEPDADEVIWEWLQDAPYPDMKYLHWAMNIWESVHTLNALERETRLATLRRTTGTSH